MKLKYATRAEEEVDSWKMKVYNQIKNMTPEENIAHRKRLEDYMKAQGLGKLLKGFSGRDKVIL